MIYQKTKLINLGTYIDKITQIMPLIKILKIHNGQIGIWKINENENKLNLLKSISNEYHPEVNQYKSKHKKNQVLSTKLLANKLLIPSPRFPISVCVSVFAATKNILLYLVMASDLKKHYYNQ